MFNDINQFKSIINKVTLNGGTFQLHVCATYVVNSPTAKCKPLKRQCNSHKGEADQREIIRKRNVENDAKVDLKLLTMEDQQDSKRPMEDQPPIV